MAAGSGSVGSYEWVNEAVLGLPSLFTDTESVEQLGSPLLVCHEGRGADWFFMYTYVFAEIGVPFPFREFECAVLRQLNCALSQIHPNSWGFIRAFEVLMDYLQEEPSLGLFFYMFQAKGVERGIWVTLSSHQRHTVFSLFKATYRDFKNFYIKVRSSEDVIPFFLDENLSQKFPFYWCRKPVQCLGVEELCERDACISEFLFENLRGGNILTTSVLLKWESDRSMVIKYLETKVPDCNTASLKSFFKQRAEKELSSSHVVKVEKGSEVNKPSEKRKPISLKRMRTEETSGKKVIDLTEGRRYGKGMASEDVAEFVKSQQGLHGFDNVEGANSLWSENYPFPMVQVARMMCISRRWELQGLEEENSKKTDALELERKLLLATEQVALKEKENGMLKEENAELKGKVAKLVKDKKDLETRVVEVCGERKEAEVSKKAHGFEMFAAAWDTAKAQAELFAPGVSFDKMDHGKVVYNGELVDDDQVPAEGSDDHNPVE
ncbi:hypothetical protein PIB30_068004 [Stylosanthes scabra]|uniref:Transposase (putative) gypsy type domain-containing protein n=1 Tax=Stylosanthes scabra TaxID=79078 RepID=A0ABU6VL61_9FABA|nr:hypothetical protein [Stylosanthes scabra]